MENSSTVSNGFRLYPVLPTPNNKGSICSYEEIKTFRKKCSRSSSEIQKSPPPLENEECHNYLNLDVEEQRVRKRVISEKLGDSRTKPAAGVLPTQTKKAPIPAPRKSTPKILSSTTPPSFETVSLSSATEAPTTGEIKSTSTTPVPAALTPALTSTDAAASVNVSKDSGDSEDLNMLSSWADTASFKKSESAINKEEIALDRKKSVKWFKSTQARNLLRDDGEIYKATEMYMEWFHGIITRKAAEELLAKRPVGSFLVRVGETRLGYTLSFKDDTRCRHYMIDCRNDSFLQVSGEDTCHKSLRELVSFYQKNKLTNWNGQLTLACPQKEGECNYSELVITPEEEQKLAYILNKPRLEASAPAFDCTPELPPPAFNGFCENSHTAPERPPILVQRTAPLPPPVRQSKDPSGSERKNRPLPPRPAMS